MTHPTIRATSEAIGIPECTIYNYLKKADFKEKYQKAKADIITQATTYMQGKTAEIINIVIDIANDVEIHPQTRLSACRTMLEYLVKFTETSDIITQIQELKDKFDMCLDNNVG